jgi:hypothetical protein
MHAVKSIMNTRPGAFCLDWGWVGAFTFCGFALLATCFRLVWSRSRLALLCLSCEKYDVTPVRRNTFWSDQTEKSCLLTTPEPCFYWLKRNNRDRETERERQRETGREKETYADKEGGRADGGRGGRSRE